MPPSTCSTWAVIQDDLSLNKKQAILEMSSTVPIRFRGWRWAFASFFSGVFNNPAASGVSVNEGAITLTLTEGAHSAAKDFAKPSMAPLQCLLAYGKVDLAAPQQTKKERYLHERIVLNLAVFVEGFLLV